MTQTDDITSQFPLLPSGSNAAHLPTQMVQNGGGDGDQAQAPSGPNAGVMFATWASGQGAHLLSRMQPRLPPVPGPGTSLTSSLLCIVSLFQPP